MVTEALPIGQLRARRPFPARMASKGNLIYKLVTTTDHKLIGMMYCVACFIFFFLGGLMALFMRAELTVPGMQFLSNEQYNQLFTMHGTVMLLFYATPIVFGFANLVLPLQIGAPDVAFPPRLNALSFWLFLFGALIALAGFITPGGAADFGWTAYTPPLSSAINTPGAGADLWILADRRWSGHHSGRGQHGDDGGLHARPPGMTMFRMPIFTWNIFVTSILVLVAFPLLTAALFALAADRHLGAHIFFDPPANGGGDLVAAPVLVLRAPPRGVHHRAAVLRHRLGDLPGVLAQADLRLHHTDLRHDQHRGAVGGGVGAPHVRHGRGAAAVLQLHDVPDRGAHRHQVLQLDRHDVEGPAHIRDTDAVLHRLPGDVPARWSVGCAAGQPADRLPGQRYLFRGGALPLRVVRHDRVCDLRRDLLLVPEDDGPAARRATGQAALFLADVHRLPHHVPGAALAGQ